MERFRIPAATNLSSDKGIRFRWPLDVKHLWLFFWCHSSEYSCSIYSLKHLWLASPAFQGSKKLSDADKNVGTKSPRPSAQRSVVCVQPFLANCWFAGKLLYWSLQPISIGGVQFWGGPSGLLSCSVFSYKPSVSCQKKSSWQRKGTMI